jgi:hypothetical protein
MINPIIDEEGNTCYYNHLQQYHREDGPAFLHTSGSIAYWINGELHRTDGPAFIDERGYQVWYLYGDICYDNKSFQEAAKLSDEDMIAIVLKYGNVCGA